MTTDVGARSPVGTPARRRRAPGWLPNQHGAWAMLASPLLVGVLAGGFAWVHLLLAVFWFAGYLAFFATSLWLKSGRRARFLPPVRVYAAVAAGLGAALAVLRPDLLSWAPLFVVPLGVALYAAARRRDRTLLAGLTTVVGSALMTVVAYAAGPGQDLGRAWLLATVQLLYFAGTVFYVKSAIRERGDAGFLRVSVGFHLAAVAATSLLSWWLGLVFALLAVRAAVLPRLGLRPAALGIGEVLATVVVAVVSLLTL